MSVHQIVYLDFDGVLHPSSSIDKDLFCKAHLLESLFASVPASSSVSIVISSSWRFTHTLASLKAKLPHFLAQHVVDMTGPAVIGKHARYQEITAHAHSNDEVVQWRALDDSYWEFPGNCQELIRCNPNTGIGPKEIAQLSAWIIRDTIDKV